MSERKCGRCGCEIEGPSVSLGEWRYGRQCATGKSGHVREQTCIELLAAKVAELEGQNKMLLGVVSGDIGFACELTKMLEERDASLSPEQREAEQQASQKRAAEIINGIDFNEAAEAGGGGS